MVEAPPFGVAQAPPSLFAITYHPNVCKSCYPCLNDFIICLRVMRRLGFVLDYVYEKDSKGKLHMHATLLTHHSWGEVITETYINNYNHMVDLITDYDGWYAYIMKDQHYDQDNDEGFKLPYRIV